MRTLEIINLPTGFLRPPDYVDARVLAAGVAEQHTVPAGAAFVLFSANTDFFAAYGTNPTAVVPAADVTGGTSNELNPTQRYVQGLAKISLISSAGGIVTLAFYGA